MIRTISIATLICIGLTIGCGDGGAGAAIIQRRSNLQTLGTAYLDYHQANGKSAGSVSELTGFLAQSEASPEITKATMALEEGDIVMIWNGKLGDAAENEEYVLGFEAGVPSKGGYVVMADGDVRLMTQKDFSEATMLQAGAS